MDSRALIFSNLINGVPVRDVCAAFALKSEDEAMYVFSFILRKIKSYCFLRARQKNAYPIITAATIKEAQKFRLTCLAVLPKLNLDKMPQYKDIVGENITPDNAAKMHMSLNARPDR